MVKASINGFGRIGRIAFRVWLSREDLQSQLDIPVINTSGSMPVSGWAHLLKYDTSYGPLKEDLKVEEVKAVKSVKAKAAPKASVTPGEIKKQIRALKSQRAAALESQDKRMAHVYKRRISRLKKQSRKAAAFSAG